MTKFLIFFSLLWSFFGMGQNIWMTPNQGQWDARIDYSVDLNQGKLYIEDDGLCYYFTDALSHDHEHHEDHHEKHQDEAHKINRYHAIKQTFNFQSRSKWRISCTSKLVGQQINIKNIKFSYL